VGLIIALVAGGLVLCCGGVALTLGRTALEVGPAGAAADAYVGTVLAGDYARVIEEALGASLTGQ
jgi:hypothetical protein